MCPQSELKSMGQWRSSAYQAYVEVDIKDKVRTWYKVNH